MPFLQLTLAIGSADPEPFEIALLEAGATSITLEDAADDPVLEPAPGTTPLWPTVRLKALFDSRIDQTSILLTLSGQLPGALPDARFDPIADRVWEREWLKDFRPMQFGRRLWICPDGQRPAPSDLQPSALSRPPPIPSSQPVCIDLDPGLAFGTGTHPTTALCLDWLDSAVLAGKDVLDYGCGSGILAIAALKLGARSALAVDIDPQAVTATLDNARRNGVADRLVTSQVDTMVVRPVEVVLANILAEPLEQLASSLADLVKPGGDIVLSGILSSQAARLASIYGAWFDMPPATTRDDWARLHGTRRA